MFCGCNAAAFHGIFWKESLDLPNWFLEVKDRTIHNHLTRVMVGNILRNENFSKSHDFFELFVCAKNSKIEFQAHVSTQAPPHMGSRNLAWFKADLNHSSASYGKRRLLFVAFRVKWRKYVPKTLCWIKRSTKSDERKSYKRRAFRSTLIKILFVSNLSTMQVLFDWENLKTINPDVYVPLIGLIRDSFWKHIPNILLRSPMNFTEIPSEVYDRQTFDDKILEMIWLTFATNFSVRKLWDLVSRQREFKFMDLSKTAEFRKNNSGNLNVGFRTWISLKIYNAGRRNT